MLFIPSSLLLFFLLSEIFLPPLFFSLSLLFFKTNSSLLLKHLVVFFQLFIKLLFALCEQSSHEVILVFFHSFKTIPIRNCFISVFDRLYNTIFFLFLPKLCVIFQIFLNCLLKKGNLNFAFCSFHVVHFLFLSLQSSNKQTFFVLKLFNLLHHDRVSV